MLRNELGEDTPGIDGVAGGIDMKLDDAAGGGELAAEGVHDKGDPGRKREEGARHEDGDDLFGGGCGLIGAAAFDAAALTFGNFDPAFALDFIQGGTQGAAANLKAFTQLTLPRELFFPVAVLDAFTKAVHRLRHKGEALGKTGGGGLFVFHLVPRSDQVGRGKGR